MDEKESPVSAKKKQELITWVKKYDSLTPSNSEVSDFVSRIPKRGIGFRCDTAVVAREVKRKGLIKKSNNYFILVPPINIEISDIEFIRDLLFDEINYSLVTVDPWANQGFIRYADKQGYYSSYYESNTNSRPAISCFVSPDKVLFSKVTAQGARIGKKIVGDVSEFGAIPSQFFRRTVILSTKDVAIAEALTTELLSPKHPSEIGFGTEDYRRIMWHFICGQMMKKMMISWN